MICIRLINIIDYFLIVDHNNNINRNNPITTIMITIIVFAVIMLVSLGYNHWEKYYHSYRSKLLSYNSNEGLSLKVNQRRSKLNPISDSTYNKRVGETDVDGECSR
ncbi:unnamed protein product [Trichobilharzia regenti]|nr:unnamed protein product [Trichobilharzia regenti]